MKKCPEVGSRVRYKGGLSVGPCEGTVLHVYIKRSFDEDQSDEWNAVHGKQLPQSEWHVSMKPDVLPRQWPYVGSDRFAPQVSELEKA